MKMSDVFKLPIHDNMKSILPFVKEPYTEIGVIAPTIVAVNNHDALVEALKSITKKLNWNGNGSCDYCGSECPNHKDDCDYISAINLLDKIKGA